ncbi:MAG: ATP-dependent helicase [Candidatus Woesearchaeota archaeon]
MKLSKEKEEILKDEEHNVKVVAGPGAGKTTLLVEKVKRLLEKGISANKILVISYTNKSAEDIELKISEKINNIKDKIDINNIYVSTIHGFCTRFIKEYNNYFKEYKGFQILDELGQLLFIVKHINKIRENNVKEEPVDLKNYFGRIKDNYSREEIYKIEHPLKKSYLNYCQLLKDNKKLDFGDLINTVIDKINTNKDLKKIASEKFDFIFVDEYQDINKNQERLLKLFKSDKNKIWVVGDKNQSIYGFRGSDITLFENFEKSFDNVKTYYLLKNYRSTWNIINLSNEFMDLKDDKKIIGNEDIEDGELTEIGSKISIKQYPDEITEAKELVKLIKKLKMEIPFL